MRNDVPAALPLIALVAGLTCGSLLVNPWVAIAGLLLVTPRLGRASLFAAAGIALALHLGHVRDRERTQFEQFDADRFVIIEAPIERDWSARGGVSVLRASHFRANGVAFDEPIAIYARFAPPEIAMEKSVRVEAFLRAGERGQYSASVKAPELLAYTGTLPWWDPAAWNRALANRLEPSAAEHPQEVALAQALVLGRGERLDETLRDRFRRGGTYHLLVFSGLQIAFAAAILAMLLRWLHKPRASDWLLLIFSLLAPLFIGSTASVVRASIGIGLYAISRIARRPTSLENLWCVAALLRLIVEPRDLTDPAFHLTYAGAGALLFIGKHAPRTWRWAANAVGAEIAITPLVLFHFHQYALGGSVITLLMAPLIFAMLIVSSLACAAPSDALFATIAALNRACDALNTITVSGAFTAPPLGALLAGFAGAMLAIAVLRERRRAAVVALVLLIPTAAAMVRYAAQRSVANPHVLFLDIGQGDSIALRAHGHTVLVDGGPDRRVVSLLADRGIVQIDTVVLTHAHPDHCEGLIAVVSQLRVGSVWLSPRRFRGDCATRLLEACRVAQTGIHLVRDGDVLQVDEVRATAHVGSHAFRHSPDNNASVVLRAELGGMRVLLTGDVEREAELDLSDRDFRADLLKVAHHGSRSSTSAALLDAVAPRIAVISCGRRNLFGHPHPLVLEALGERRVRTWRTDRDGTVDVEIAGGRLYVRSRKD